MKSTSTKGPDSAVEGRRQNPGQTAKNIGERQSEPPNPLLSSLRWPIFLLFDPVFCLLPQLRSLVPGYSLISPPQTTSRLAPLFGRQNLYRGKKSSDNAGGKPTCGFSLQHKTTTPKTLEPQ